MAEATVTKQALRLATPEQLEAIARKLDSENCDGVFVQAGGLGLPDGYLAIRIDYATGGPIYGGIDPEGNVST